MNFFIKKIRWIYDLDCDVVYYKFDEYINAEFLFLIKFIL